jgi:signal recognition particle GTPase
MPDTNRPSAAQQLRQVAVQQEAELLGKNEYKEESTEYQIDGSSTPTEIDGAKQERTKLSVMNIYNGDNTYQNPDGVTI